MIRFCFWFVMMRFNFWLMLHRLILALDNKTLEAVIRTSRWFHCLTMKASGYCLDRLRKEIPDEFQHLLVDREEIDDAI